MFERYTETARRVLFFARYEASELGQISIETEHLLLGLLRELHGEEIAGRILARAGLSLDDTREDIRGRVPLREKLPTSVEIPFSDKAKRVLLLAAKDADGLRHDHIGPEHLLIAILREEGSIAASILAAKGLDVESVRKDIGPNE